MYFYSTRSQKSKIKMQVGWFLVKTLFLAYRHLPCHCVLICSFLCACVRGHSMSYWVPFLIRTFILLDHSPTFLSHLNLIMSFRPYLQIQIHSVKASIYRFWEYTTQSIAVPNLFCHIWWCLAILCNCTVYQFPVLR